MKKISFTKIISLIVIVALMTSLFTGCQSDEEQDLSQEETVMDKSEDKEEDKEEEVLETQDLVEEVKPDLLIQEDLPSLFESYEDYFKVGVALPLSFLVDDNVDALLLKHFNSMTAENSMKPEGMLNAGNKEAVNFTSADMYVNYADENGIGVRGHTLVWHSQTPDWFFRKDFADRGSLVERDEMLVRMENYIAEIMTRYKDSNIYAWDVANEVIDISTEDNMRDSLWYNIVGPDFVEKAFEYARKYSKGTDVKLFYNDYNIVASEEKRMAIFEMCKELKDKGLIDGVGLQAHINYAGPGVEEFRETIELFESIGLEVHITELDISLYKSTKDRINGEFDQRLIQQAYLYKNLFDLFKEYSDTVTSVTVWALTDDVSWLNNFPVKRTNWPVLFDKDFQAKDAFLGLVDPSLLPVYTNSFQAEKATADLENIDLMFLNKVPALITDNESEVAASTVVWDENYLYFKTSVIDDTITDDDYVMIQLDMNNSKSINQDEDDRIVKVYANKTASYSSLDNEQLFSDLGDNLNILTTDDGDCLLQVINTDVGYETIVGFPITTSGFRMNTIVGFDYVVANQDTVYHWHDNYSNQLTVPENFANLKLDKARKSTAAIYGQPIIDGQLDDIWDQANEIKIDTYTLGSEGAYGSIKTLRDENFLYVYANVIDDQLQAVNGNAYEQDSIEIFIDENAARSSTYEADDVQYRINYENSVTINGGPAGLEIESFVTITDTGYSVELAIPFLQGSKNVGRAIGFDVQFNDDRGSGARESMTNWNDLTGEGWSSTSSYGTLVIR